MLERKELVKFLRAISQTHCRLLRLLCSLQRVPGVLSVVQDVHSPEGADGFFYEQFVDAELTSGEARCWRLEIWILDDDIVVEADVRQQHGLGYDVLEEVWEKSYASTDECASELPHVAAKLCAACPLPELPR